MPAPDLIRPRRVDAKLRLYQFPSGVATTTPVTLLTAPADTVYRIRSLYISNASVSMAITITLNDGVASRLFIRSATIGQNTNFNAISANDALYLEPGDFLQVNNSAAPTAGLPMSVFIVYEVVV